MRTETALFYLISSVFWLGAPTWVETTGAGRDCNAEVLGCPDGAKGIGKTVSEFRDCAVACSLMVVIPAGKFTMGSSENEVGRTAGEGPQHGVTIAEPLAVSKYEVTFDQWDACMEAAGCPSSKDAWGRGVMPVINVSWDDAKLYVAWLSRVTGKEYRLLSEAEWEYATRSGSNTRYSWGDEPGMGIANCDGCDGAPILQTAPVGSFRPNTFGLLDMHGNVWEWVEDIWHDSYDGAPVDGSAWLQGGDANYRVIRGGSWHNETDLVRAAVRFERERKVRFDTLGFRVARSMRP
jgi:formylglycine-generating enzyme required for sulfatase activity